MFCGRGPGAPTVTVGTPAMQAARAAQIPAMAVGGAAPGTTARQTPAPRRSAPDRLRRRNAAATSAASRYLFEKRKPAPSQLGLTRFETRGQVEPMSEIRARIVELDEQLELFDRAEDARIHTGATDRIRLDFAEALRNPRYIALNAIRSSLRARLSYRGMVEGRLELKPDSPTGVSSIIVFSPEDTLWATHVLLELSPMVTIGSAGDVSLVNASDIMSQRHATIIRVDAEEEGGAPSYFITDGAEIMFTTGARLPTLNDSWQDSRNGTFINGFEISSDEFFQLLPGDEIEIGDHQVEWWPPESRR